MIDFHTHILPEVDDGSKSYEESLSMLKEAKSAGFDIILSTSHYATGCYEVPEYKRKELIEDLSLEENIPEIILGSEIFLTYNIVELLKEFKASTINGTNYVLIELPLKKKIVNLENEINILKENGYIPIIAHPERCIYIQKNYKILDKLSKAGVLFQCNYGSIIGNYGFRSKYIMKKMLKDNLVSFLGTDSHKMNHIYLQISQAISSISKYISTEKLVDLVNNNAEKILRGEEL